VEHCPKDKHGEFFWTVYEYETFLEIDYGYANTQIEAWEIARRSKDKYERKNPRNNQ
jgi:hypothetical protein